MIHSILLWLASLITGAPEPVVGAEGPTHAEAIEIAWRGRRFRIVVEELGS